MEACVRNRDAGRWPVRILALAIAATLALGASARPAQASGCHAPERPALELSWSFEDAPGLADVQPPDFDPTRVPESPGVAPRPCSGDDAAPPASVVPPGPSSAGWGEADGPQVSPRSPGPHAPGDSNLASALEADVPHPPPRA
jgi:hypothetical protein